MVEVHKKAVDHPAAHFGAVKKLLAGVEERIEGLGRGFPGSRLDRRAEVSSLPLEADGELILGSSHDTPFVNGAKDAVQAELGVTASCGEPTYGRKKSGSHAGSSSFKDTVRNLLRMEPHPHNPDCFPQHMRRAYAVHGLCIPQAPVNPV